MKGGSRTRPAAPEMRRINQERHEERRRHIRDAALLCFKRSGFHQTSIAEICAEARMSPGNLYRYYYSKEAIIEAICEDDRQRVTNRIQAMQGRENLMVAMLEIAGESMRAITNVEQSRFASEILAEAMRNPRVGDIVRRHNAALLALCAEAIRQAQEMKQIDATLDPRLAATLLMGVAEGLGTRLALSPDLDARKCVETFQLLIARFLRP